MRARSGDDANSPLPVPRVLTESLALSPARCPTPTRCAARLLPQPSVHCRNCRTAPHSKLGTAKNILVRSSQYFGYNTYCNEGEGGREGTVIAYNAIVRIIYNPSLYCCRDFFPAVGEQGKRVGERQAALQCSWRCRSISTCNDMR